MKVGVLHASPQIAITPAPSLFMSFPIGGPETCLVRGGREGELWLAEGGGAADPLLHSVFCTLETGQNSQSYVFLPGLRFSCTQSIRVHACRKLQFALLACASAEGELLLSGAFSAHQGVGGVSPRICLISRILAARDRKSHLG